MSDKSYLYGGPPVIGVSCRNGHFEVRRRRLSSPLFPVVLATVGVVIDFAWAFPTDQASYYLPVILINIVIAWIVLLSTDRLRHHFLPLPTLCPLCKGKLDSFLGSVDTQNGPNEIEVVSAILFLLLHLAIIVLI